MVIYRQLKTRRIDIFKKQDTFNDIKTILDSNNVSYEYEKRRVNYQNMEMIEIKGAEYDLSLALEGNIVMTARLAGNSTMWASYPIDSIVKFNIYDHGTGTPVGIEVDGKGYHFVMKL